MARDDGRTRTGGIVLYLGGILLLVAAGMGVYSISHVREAGVEAQRTDMIAEAERGPRVEVVTVNLGAKQRDITLLGDVKANSSATIYSKVNGYLKTISVDRGDRVQAGQIIAEVNSAETDSQYASAVADLANKKRLAARDKQMKAEGHVSVQAAEASDTSWLMAEANVRQLGTLKSYETLRAPFAGMVTARFADPGQLIQNATSGQSNALPVLTIADMSSVKVAAYVQQRDVPFVRVGTPAEVADGAHPDQKLKASITRSTGALDPKTHSLYVEIDVDNSAGLIVPGSFAQVTLHVTVQSRPQIPARALVIRGGNTFVAAVDEQGKVHFHPVKVASTSGAVIDISEGVASGDKLAVSLPDEVGDGSQIRPVALTAQLASDNTPTQ